MKQTLDILKGMSYRLVNLIFKTTKKLILALLKESEFITRMDIPYFDR